MSILSFIVRKQSQTGKELKRQCKQRKRKIKRNFETTWKKIERNAAEGDEKDTGQKNVSRA